MRLDESLLISVSNGLGSYAVEEQAEAGAVERTYYVKDDDCLGGCGGAASSLKPVWPRAGQRVQGHAHARTHTHKRA